MAAAAALRELEEGERAVLAATTDLRAVRHLYRDVTLVFALLRLLLLLLVQP